MDLTDSEAARKSRASESRAARIVRPQTLHRARLGFCSCGGVVSSWKLARSLHFGHQVRCKVHGRGVAYSLVKALLSRECHAKSAPTDDITRHTGAARITRLRMRPMSLFETGHATGAISLAALLAGESARSQESTLTVTDLATLVRDLRVYAQASDATVLHYRDNSGFAAHVRESD